MLVDGQGRLTVEASKAFFDDDYARRHEGGCAGPVCDDCSVGHWGRDTAGAN